MAFEVDSDKIAELIFTKMSEHPKQIGSTTNRENT